MKYTFLAILLVISTLTILAVQQKQPLFAPRASQPENQIRVGPEQQIYVFEKNSIPDFPYLTIDTSSGLIGVLSIGSSGVGDQRAYKVSNPLSAKLSENLTPINGLTRGTDRSYPDWGGVWLADTLKDQNSNVIHGIYHSETHKGTGTPNLTNDVWTVAYIKSSDGGQSWVKPNYPNNVLLTSVNNVSPHGISPTSFVKTGNKVRLYFFENTPSKYRGMGVAEASLSDLGRSEGWKKYYCPNPSQCGFDEPGKGGKITNLKGIYGRTPVSFNSYLQKYIALNGDLMLNSGILQLSSSSDGINFENYGSPLQLDNNIGPGWVPVYYNFIGQDGITGQTAESFYLYYVLIKRDPKTEVVSDPKRYLVRRLVTLDDNDSSKDTMLDTPLHRLYNSKTRAHFYTTAVNELNSAKRSGYVYEGTCCKIAETQVPGTVPLYQVQLPTDFFLETDRDQIKRAEKKGYTNSKIKGYCFPKQNAPENSMPLFRFYSKVGTNHFYTISTTERQKLLNNPEWTYEGEVCYVN